MLLSSLAAAGPAASTQPEQREKPRRTPPPLSWPQPLSVENPHVLLLGVMPKSLSHSLAAHSWGGPLFQPLSVELHLLNAGFCSVNKAVGPILALAPRVLPVTPLLLSKAKQLEKSQHIVLPKRPREEQRCCSGSPRADRDVGARVSALTSGLSHPVSAQVVEGARQT